MLKVNKILIKPNRVCQDKMPAEISELLLSEHILKHIMKETVKYTRVCQNDFTFSMTEYELKCYVRAWFLTDEEV